MQSGRVYPEVTDEQTPHFSTRAFDRRRLLRAGERPPSTQGRFSELQQAEARHRERCTNRSLQGYFATMVEGYFLAGAAQVPLRSVALTHFDGRGNVSQVDHAVVDGMTPPADWTPATGTYKVNPDCTGAVRVEHPREPGSHL